MLTGASSASETSLAAEVPEGKVLINVLRVSPTQTHRQQNTEKPAGNGAEASQNAPGGCMATGNKTANKHEGNHTELPEACRHDVAHTARTTRSCRKRMAAVMKKEPDLLLLLLGFSCRRKIRK